MMKKFVEGPWLYRILALFLALLLFGYVNLDEINTTRQTNNNDTQMLATRTETVKVPLQINADTDRYFITGYPQKVKVKLSGPNALVTSAVNTLNFRVIGDLTKLGPGDHTVKLKQTGISKDIKVTIEPKEIKVHIEHKVTKQFPVQVNVKKENLAAGYSLGNPKLSQDVVEVSGAKSAVNAVSQVVATVDPDEGTKKDINEEVLLQAVDRNGKALNVLISPQTVNVKILVQMSKKTLPISLEKTGEKSGYSYSLSSTTDSVTVYGRQTALAKLTSLPVSVDLSSITSSTSKTVKVALPDNIYESTPSAIKVTITVTPDTTNTSATSTVEAPSESTAQTSSSAPVESSSSNSQSGSQSSSSESSKANTDVNQ
ncbi:CdaR family protein [Latilactobacillus curvatus]|uniref:CdaR family protein n=1 Tax=Latilactobacillus curvatus TaxID=28038 RepID=UPI0009D68A65|nr:CdaR family protein [Latilactobacillus curvatus]